MNINFKKKGYKIALISFIILILFFFSVIYCTNRISNELEHQLETNLIDVANQNALAISNQLNDNYMLLDSLFAEIKEIPGDISENVMLLKGFVKANNLKRVTYCTPDGTAYTTDNVVTNLSYREFFKRGLQGKSTITGVLTDAIRPDTDEKIIIFSSPMYDNKTEELLRNQQLEERFDFAIANHNFEVWYQPKYSASTKEIVGSEALVRWRETDGKLIPPGRFIPLFERDGYISRLDEYVFREVCRKQKYWLDKGFKVCPVSVNISRATIYGANVVDKYLGILDSFELPHEYIQLEVLESAISGKADIAKILERFRLSGVHILMDDFGTGYSSLATLNMHCFDTLKLDKSLIDCIGEKDGETLLHYVIKMGRHLGLHITAEGVEYESQLSYLQEQKCDDIQGYLFSKPLHIMDYERLITG